MTHEFSLKLRTHLKTKTDIDHSMTTAQNALIIVFLEENWALNEILQAFSIESRI